MLMMTHKQCDGERIATSAYDRQPPMGPPPPQNNRQIRRGSALPSKATSKLLHQTRLRIRSPKEQSYNPSESAITTAALGVQHRRR